LHLGGAHLGGGRARARSGPRPRRCTLAPFTDERRFGGNFGWNMVLFDGYQALDATDAVYGAADVETRPPGSWLGPLPAHVGEVREVGLAVEDARVDGLLYDDPQDPVAGFDTLYLGLDRDPTSGITLKPVPVRPGQPDGFAPLRMNMGGGESPVYFRLYSLAPDGSDLLLYRTPVQLIRAHPPRLEEPALQASGGFVGNGSSWTYADGKLGPPVGKGGDGTAERRYLESAALVARQYTRLTDFAFDKTPWDLLLAYLPYPDEALHTWLGVLIPARPATTQRWRRACSRSWTRRGPHRRVHRPPGRPRRCPGGADHQPITAWRSQPHDPAPRPPAAAGRWRRPAERWTSRTQAICFRGNAGGAGEPRGPAGRHRDARPGARRRRKVVAALKAVRDPQTGKAASST
jgi:hypothetical protein